MLRSRRAIKVSIVGRPNCGKSTLVNALLQQERVICDDTAGTTRDAISVDWVYKGKKIKLIDTAGIEKQFKTRDIIEKKCNEQTKKTLNHSDIVIFMIDSLHAFQEGDLKLSQYIADEVSRASSIKKSRIYISPVLIFIIYCLSSDSEGLLRARVHH